MGETIGQAWLSLEEAAQRLGVSRLRLREGIAAGAIRAQRDNRGFWRVMFDDAPDAVVRRLSGVRLEAADRVGLLFDEIEELNLALEDRSGEIERLTALLARHETILEKALSLAESAGAPGVGPGAAERLGLLAERADALIERTVGTLERKESDLARMTGLVDRALSTVEALDAEVARQSEAAVKQQALLERVLALAHASLDRMTGGGVRRGFFARIRSRRAGEKGGDR